MTRRYQGIRVLEDLQADPREVLMEGPQRGSNAVRSGMQHLPVEQDRTHSSGRVTSAITDTGAEVGKYLNGIHYKVTQGTGTRLLICSGRSVDHICSLLCYLFRLVSNTSS